MKSPNCAIMQFDYAAKVPPFCEIHSLTTLKSAVKEEALLMPLVGSEDGETEMELTTVDNQSAKKQTDNFHKYCTKETVTIQSCDFLLVCF